MAEHIMVVEDEIKLAELLRDYLHNSGFTTTLVHRGDEVEAAFAAHTPNLILLDLMLPGIPGLEVCSMIRRKSQVPIIMVTARVEEIDRLLGLEMGADDYICKPFSPREVVARVRTVLRRMAPRNEAEPELLTLDDAGFRALLLGKDLGLTVVEYQLLKTLAVRPGRIFSRDQLMNTIYNDNRIVADRTIDSHIKKIRKKMAAVMPDQELIHSVYSAGYKFERTA